MSDRHPNPIRSHDALVARLVADAHPIHRSWPPSLRLCAWTAMAGSIMVAFSAHNRLPHLGDRFVEPIFASQVASLVVAAVWCAWLAFRASVPGREPRTPEILATIPLVGLPALLAFRLAPEAVGDAHGFIRTGAMCAVMTLGLASAPWLAGLVALRRGAPVAPRCGAALAAAAGLLAAAAAMRVVCPLGDTRWHLLAWHLVPVALGAAASAALAAHWIQRWRHTEHLEHLDRDLRRNN